MKTLEPPILPLSIKYPNDSPVQLLARLPVTERNRILQNLTEEQARNFAWDWRGWWARPNQLPPVGKWSTWIALAGRGYGKTRVISEWVREQVNTKKAARIALVAPTASDVRDVLVEGPSGIMNICPEWERPIYEPTKRRLTFPNGAMAITYSADEPERLRGPQHDAAACDELCLVAGTLIETVIGRRQIESLKVGDQVFTRHGLRRVLHCGMTNRAAEIFRLRTSDGKCLEGTAQHPVFVFGKGFVALSLLVPGDRLIPWISNSNPALFGVGAGGGSTGATTAIAAASFSIEQFTRPCMALFRKGLRFITRMKIKPTTRLIISKDLRDQNISSATDRGDGELLREINGKGNLAKNGQRKNRTRSSAITAVLRSLARGRALASVRETAKRLIGALILGSVPAFLALSAESHFCGTRLKCSFAPWPALGRISGSQKKRAWSALNYSVRRARKQCAALGSVDTCSVVDVERLSSRAAVFNIEVEGEHEYFANGILTHNCAWRYAESFDMLMFGLRMGKDPRCVVATTPKPVKLLKALLAEEGKTVAVTRGSTYENKNNLAKTFLEKIVKKYEGTRLGRQELLAELLTDVPNALWQRDNLDKLRVSRAPELTRIVIAIDPAAKSVEGSDETGIIVAGIGHDKHGYVLDDLSGRYQPLGWAKKAIWAYEHYKADRVIAEINNGGEMVEATLRSVNKNVPYKAVHATRGKVIRAEPIAALDEQGKIHHVGSFPVLEDQLCEFTLDFDRTVAGYSPDRLDARVWAFTELMPDRVSSFG